MRNRKHGGKPVDERKNHRAEQKKTLGSGFQSAFRTLKLPARRGGGNCRRSVAWLRAEVHAKALMIEKLRAQLAVLRRARFGRKSEKLDAQVEQLELMIDDIEAGVAETLARAGVAESDAAEATETGASSKKKRKPSTRAPLPDHLPAETIVHDAPCVCPACGGDLGSCICVPAFPPPTNRRCWRPCSPTAPIWASPVWPTRREASATITSSTWRSGTSATTTTSPPAPPSSTRTTGIRWRRSGMTGQPRRRTDSISGPEAAR